MNKDRLPKSLENVPEEVVEMWMDTLREGRKFTIDSYDNLASKKIMANSFAKLMEEQGFETIVEIQERSYPLNITRERQNGRVTWVERILKRNDVLVLTCKKK